MVGFGPRRDDSMTESRVFSHVVGKSTLREEITVHKDFEGWFESPEAGSKKEITSYTMAAKKCKLSYED